MHTHTDMKCRHYFICCRDGKSRTNTQKRQTEKNRPYQKPSRKLNACCISRMYATEFNDGHVEVKYISAHTAHELGVPELPNLPLPKSVKEEIAVKISMGIQNNGRCIPTCTIIKQL